MGKVSIHFQNEKDLIEIPEAIREKMEFFPVKDMDEVVKIAFSDEKIASSKAKKKA